MGRHRVHPDAASRHRAFRARRKAKLRCLQETVVDLTGRLARIEKRPRRQKVRGRGDRA